MYQLFGGHAELGANELDWFWSAYLHPEDRDSVEQALRDGIEGVKQYDTEFRIVWQPALHPVDRKGDP